MKYMLAVFDMDGTILNTIEDLADSANYICRKHGFPLHSIQEYKYFVGNGIPKLVQRFCPENVDYTEYQQALNEYIDYYGKHCKEKTRPYDGIIDLLKELKNEGFLLAVNTNKVESAAIKLCNDYFPNIFDFISGGKPENQPKPASDGLFEIFAQAGISKNEACGKVVFIGDSDVDILTGKNAGIDAIGVDWGFRGAEFLKNHGAEKIAFNSTELYQMLVSDD